MSIDLLFPLRRVFHKQEFRPGQEAIIRACVAGHDVFLVAATAFGKSLCFQLPAIISDGLTIVISPLLALMTNQVSDAKALGIAVESITGQTPQSERKRIETDLKCGHPRTRLLYATPELCGTHNFKRILQVVHTHGQLVRIVVDEAHCISEWGHDFRPAYKRLIWFRETLVDVPIFACTATATKRVKDDICRSLGLADSTTKFFTAPIARPNIHYEVQYFSESSPVSESGNDRVEYLLSWLNGVYKRWSMLPASFPLESIHGIIYVSLRALADGLASMLLHSGFHAEAYHAGLDPAKREQVQSSFLTPVHGPDARGKSNAFKIICATTAFGMGIDMPNIRFVIHWGLSRGIESFLQESGRAGRDGNAASSVVLYTREERDRCLSRGRMDAGKLSAAQVTSKASSLQAVVDFCESVNSCRHKLLNKHFQQKDGEMAQIIEAQCDYACDYCKEGTEKLKKRRDNGLTEDEEAFEFTQRESIEYFD